MTTSNSATYDDIVNHIERYSAAAIGVGIGLDTSDSFHADIVASESAILTSMYRDAINAGPPSSQLEEKLATLEDLTTACREATVYYANMLMAVPSIKNEGVTPESVTMGMKTAHTAGSVFIRARTELYSAVKDAVGN